MSGLEVYQQLNTRGASLPQLDTIGIMDASGMDLPHLAHPHRQNGLNRIFHSTEVGSKCGDVP